jgi:hypothetical protein
MFYSKYSNITGELLTLGSCPQSVYELQQCDDINESLIEIPEYTWDFYVDITTTPHEVKPKTEFELTLSKPQIAADGVDTVTISNIPNPTLVTWPDGFVSEVVGGEITFGVDLVGFHEFKFESIKHLTKTIQIEAV